MAAEALVSAVTSSSQPILSVGDELVLEKGDNLTVKCSGNKPLNWSYPSETPVSNV